MNVQVAGISIDVPRISVVIFNDDAAWPVYHASGSSGREGCSWFIRRTVCGRVIFAQRDDGDEERNGFAIATRHALKFARPCATCWPELRNRETLFKRRPGPRATPTVQEEIHG